LSSVSKVTRNVKKCINWLLDDDKPQKRGILAFTQVGALHGREDPAPHLDFLGCHCDTANAVDYFLSKINHL
jgi:hypothetical protein